MLLLLFFSLIKNKIIDRFNIKLPFSKQTNKQTNKNKQINKQTNKQKQTNK
jgi:hypothetical protein